MDSRIRAIAGGQVGREQRRGGGRILRAVTCVVYVLPLVSGCAAMGQDALQFRFPPLVLGVGEEVVAVDASVECDTQLKGRSLSRGGSAFVQTRDGVTTIRSRPGPLGTERLSFADAEGRLPTLIVADAVDDCGLWAIELEVRKSGQESDAGASDVLMLDYASHGLWYRHPGASLE